MIFVGLVLLNLEFRRELKSRTSNSSGFCCVSLKIARYVCICIILGMNAIFRRCNSRPLRKYRDDSESIGRYYRCRRKVSLERRLLSVENEMIVILKPRVTLTVSSLRVFLLFETWKRSIQSILYLSVKYKLILRPTLRFRISDLYLNRNFH